VNSPLWLFVLANLLPLKLEIFTWFVMISHKYENLNKCIRLKINSLRISISIAAFQSKYDLLGIFCINSPVLQKCILQKDLQNHNQPVINLNFALNHIEHGRLTQMKDSSLANLKLLPFKVCVGAV